MAERRGRRSRRDDGWGWHVASFGDVHVVEAQRLHRRVYEQRGYIEEMQIITDDGLLIDRWSWAANHVGLYFENHPVGHLRLIDRSAGLLPAELLWPELELPSTCWEVSALAVAGDLSRPFDTVERLYRQAYHFAAATYCTHWVGIIEQPLLRMLGRRFPMYAIGEPKEYLGTMNVPALLSFADCVEHMNTGRMDPWFRPPVGVADVGSSVS